MPLLITMNMAVPISSSSTSPLASATPTRFSLSPSPFPPRFNSPNRKGVFRISPMLLRVATTPPPVSEDDVGVGVGVMDEDAEDSGKFSWRDHWYPVSVVEDLDPRYPTAFKLLNRDLVLWFDPNASHWVAFLDLCPHRLAPLSEGRIDEKGQLQCSYHGWSFDGCGSCTRIPQAASEGPEARAVKSPKACAIKFPTMVSQGLLYVWPDENGHERAQATTPPRLPDDFDRPEFSSMSIQRDLYYSYDTFMDNVLDPAHVDFAHHKVTGNRERAKPWPVNIESTGRWGFMGANEGNPRINAKFIAPCYLTTKIEIDTKLPIVGDQHWVVWMCSFVIPMAPGKTRSIICSARNFYHFSMPGREWWKVVPRWYNHLTSNKVYDGDITVLQGQEKFFLSKSMEGCGDVNKQYSKAIFTPTQADRLVLAFRNWLRQHGNGQPNWYSSGDQQPFPSRRQLLDRYEQHTLNCSSCRGAHAKFQMLQKILIGVAVVCAAAAGIPAKLQSRIAIGAAAILSVALAYALNNFQKNFVFTDYIHADVD